MYSLFVYLTDKKSRILYDDRNWLEKFFQEYSLFAVSIVIGIVFILTVLIVQLVKIYKRKTFVIDLVGFNSVSVNRGKVFIAPITQKEGYDFAGWFYDTAFTVPYKNTQIYENKTLYPKWVK